MYNTVNTFVIDTNEDGELNDNETSDEEQGSFITYSLKIGLYSKEEACKLIMDGLALDNFVCGDGVYDLIDRYVSKNQSKLNDPSFIHSIQSELELGYYQLEKLPEKDGQKLLIAEDVEKLLVSTVADMVMDDMGSIGGNERISDKTLDDLVGMEDIKTEFREIVDYSKCDEFDRKSQCLNMIFSGDSGTGKSTMAEVVTDYFYENGLISERKLISVTAVDLIGQFVGHTSSLTKDACKSAYGGILFIDEAYTIIPKKNTKNESFRQECLATLVKEMEDHRDELIVIFAGYKKEMERLLNSNPGLKSRIYRVLDFPEYTVDEMTQIFEHMCLKDGYSINKSALAKVHDKLAALSCEENFGHVRAVREAYSAAKKESVKRRLKSNSQKKQITVGDIKIENKLPSLKELKQELDNLVGLEVAKADVSKLIYSMRFSKEKEVKIPINKNAVFMGNAGTGKTTVAKIYGQMLYEIGVSKSPKFVSIIASDLTSDNESPAESFDEYVKEANGGVLFIDEAYAIVSNPYLFSQVLPKLLDVAENKRDEITIILAGYERDMDRLFAENQGLDSRFPNKIHFPNYSVDELMEMFMMLCKEYSFIIDDAAFDEVKSVIGSMIKDENFGNARTVRNIFEQTFRNHSKNYYEGKALGESVFGLEDVYHKTGHKKVKIGF